MVSTRTSPASDLRGFAHELRKTRDDVAALSSQLQRNPRDLEKRVRLAYRQFHYASLTGDEADFQTVDRTLRALIQEFGPQEDICLLEVNLDLRFHQLAQAKQDLAACPALAKRFEGRVVLAEMDFQEGRYAEARDGFETLIAENRTWDNLARLAHWKAKMGCPDEADALYREAEDGLTAKEMRSFAWLELQRGLVALSRSRYDKARAHYERAAAGYPGHWLTDEHLAELLAAEGEFEEALGLLKDVVSRAPKPELKQALGELLLFMGRPEQAQPWFDAALEAYLKSASNGGVHYYHHLADFFADAGRQPAEAVKWARKDLVLRSNFNTQAALAWALFQAGNADEAVTFIRPALSSGVQDSGIFATASLVFRAIGAPAESEAWALKAAEINPRGHDFRMHH